MRNMASKCPNYRSQYVVDDPYQLRFIFRLFVVLVAIILASSLIAVAILWKRIPEPESQTHLIAAFHGVVLALLVELLIAIPVLFYWSIRQTHRAVGPLYRITKVLEAIGSGDFSQRLVLRDSDVLKDLASSINQMAEDLQRRRLSPTGKSVGETLSEPAAKPVARVEGSKSS